MEPIAYTYEAEHHCPACTEKRFGPECMGTDNEGNEVGALWSWDQWYEVGYGNQMLVCGTCCDILDEYEEEGFEADHPEPDFNIEEEEDPRGGDSEGRRVD